MSRNLILLNLLLLALCGLAGWRLSVYRKERVAEQTGFLARQEDPAPAPVVPLPASASRISASTYLAVAQQLLLSADRNPTVIVDVVPPKIMPPLPRAYGAMDFGQGPRVVLAEKAGAPQRSYPIGERIGDFKILAVNRAGVVFEWDGKRVPATFDEMRDTTTAPSAAPPPQATITAGATATQTTIKKITASGEYQGKPGPGAGQMRPCMPGDTSPAGSVSDGYRKSLTEIGGFGKTCLWEKVN